MKNKSILIMLGLLVIFIGLVIGIFHIRHKEFTLSTGIPFSGSNESTISSNPAISQGKININAASAEELSHLPGIGTALAIQIVQYRIENGSFTATNDLMDIDGMTKSICDGLKQYITTD